MSVICSNDKQRFTKECLYLSLMQLLKKKSIKAITVKELCEKAGLSRMAFYRNYSIVEDILEEHIEYDLCGGDLDEGYANSVGLEKLITDYYFYLKENRAFVLLLVDSELTQMLYHATDRMLSKFSYLIPGQAADSYLHAVLVSTILALVIEWTREDMVRPCGEMAALTLRLLGTISACGD